jgi:hypothetical protein
MNLDKLFSLTPNTLTNILTTTPDTLDNSWLCQNVFYNMNFTRKQPKKKQEVGLRPTFKVFQINWPKRLACAVTELSVHYKQRYFSPPGYFSPRRSYRRVPKFCMGF